MKKDRIGKLLNQGRSVKKVRYPRFGLIREDHVLYMYTWVKRMGVLEKIEMTYEFIPIPNLTQAMDTIKSQFHALAQGKIVKPTKRTDSWKKGEDRSPREWIKFYERKSPVWCPNRKKS